MHRAVALLAALVLAAFPQSPPTFEVTSIRPNVSASNSSSWSPDHHGGFKAENTSLKALAQYAYHVPKLLISGPAWMDTVRFDINAKGPNGASDNQVKLMLRALLEERFRLCVHRETKEMAVYILEVAGGGLKVQPLDPSKPGIDSRFPRGSWSALTMTGTLTAFAESLTDFAGRPVIDRTGIPGEFRLKFWYNDGPESEGPDLFNALREELGLRLKPGRDSVEILVVDSAEKRPLEN